MKKRTWVVCAIIGVMLLGSAAAFFTDRGSAVNEFVVGNVTIELTEPSWNPDEATALTPNKSLKKDPQVTNTGSNDAFVFLQVSVPNATVKTASANGTVQEAKQQDLFTYAINDDWQMVDKQDSNGKSVYTYAFVNSDGSMQTLAPQGNTGALFDSVKFINLIEGEVDPHTRLSIDVDAMAIQTEDLGVSSALPANVLQLIRHQNS